MIMMMFGFVADRDGEVAGAGCCACAASPPPAAIAAAVRADALFKSAVRRSMPWLSVRSVMTISLVFCLSTKNGLETQNGEMHGGVRRIRRKRSFAGGRK
jgi:hypothetical protein